MKKWSEVKNEPVTWGGCVKLCGRSALIIFIIYAIAVIATMIWYYADTISEKISNFIHKVKTKFKKK